MIQAALWRMVEGITAPRRSVRAMLDADPGFDVVVSFVVLGYVLQAIASILLLDLVFPEARPTGPQPSALVFHLFNVLLQFFMFFVVSGLVFWLGRLFGGTGTLPGAMIALAWYFLVTSLLTPVLFFGVGSVMAETGGGIGVLLLLVSMAIGLWVFANYVSELHGFGNTWAVLGVVLGLLFASSIILSALTSGPA